MASCYPVKCKVHKAAQIADAVKSTLQLIRHLLDKPFLEESTPDPAWFVQPRSGVTGSLDHTKPFPGSGKASAHAMVRVGSTPHGRHGHSHGHSRRCEAS